MEYASEFRYRNPVVSKDDVVIAISQSGETADTLAAIQLAKEQGAFIYGICNAIGSSIPFHGMTDGLRRLDHDVRIEKVVWKDIKLRTFISDGAERNDLAAHVYDITYGSLVPFKDNLVVSPAA